MVGYPIANPLLAAELVLLGASPLTPIRLRTVAKPRGKTWNELQARTEQATLGGFA